MSEHADLEITLSSFDPPTYSVVLRFERPDSEASKRQSGKVSFNFEALLEHGTDPVKYGRSLTENLLSDSKISDFYKKAVAVAQSHTWKLRLRLWIDHTAPELHQIRWETLRTPDDSDFLAQNGDIHFSRYLESSDWTPVHTRPKGDMRALIVIANPADLSEKGFAPIEVENEHQRARVGLADIRTIDELITKPDEDSHVTLPALISELRKGYDILYLVCHGIYKPRDPKNPFGARQSGLWLEKPNGASDLIPGDDLVQQIQNLPSEIRPLLVFLASCQSSGTGAVPSPAQSTDNGALSALGPQLSQAGVPAVIAMQGNVFVNTVSEFMPVFFESLMEDGRLDRSMAVARNLTSVKDQSDWWAPVLFTRYKSGRMFSDVADRKGLPALPGPSTLPNPGSLPLGSYLPFPRNHTFTGREHDLETVAAALFYYAPGAARRIALTGGGGMGKSQIAVEFCYRFGRFTHGVFWLDATQSIVSQIVACGEAMKLPGWENLELPEQVQHTLQVWEEKPERLVVLDNLDEPPELGAWLELLKEHPVLVTSRRDDYEPETGITVHTVQTLPRPKSLELLRKLARRLKKVTDNTLDELCVQLGDLPLALDLAGRYLAKEGIDIPDYQDELAEEESLLEHESFISEELNRTTAHVRSLTATFRYSWKYLQTENEYDILASRVFLSSGYCAPNVPIPEELLQESLELEGKAGSRKLKRALNRLNRMGLLTESEGSAVIHSLMAEFARILDSDLDASVFPDISSALITMAITANNSGFPTQFLPLRPHVQSVGDWAGDRDLEVRATLWNNMGYFLESVADFNGARPYYEQALAIRMEVLGEKHPDTASSLNNLGYLLQAMGDYGCARPYYEQALAINREVLGEKHPDTALSLNNLGYLLDSMGDYDGARPYYEQALAIDKEVLGEKHPDYAIDLNNMGVLLGAMGDLPGARPYYEQALAIFEQTLPPGHPYIEGVRRNLESLDE